MVKKKEMKNEATNTSRDHFNFLNANIENE